MPDLSEQDFKGISGRIITYFNSLNPQKSLPESLIVDFLSAELVPTELAIRVLWRMLKENMLFLRMDPIIQGRIYELCPGGVTKDGHETKEARRSPRDKTTVNFSPRSLEQVCIVGPLCYVEHGPIQSGKPLSNQSGDAIGNTFLAGASPWMQKGVLNLHAKFPWDDFNITHDNGTISFQCRSCSNEPYVCKSELELKSFQHHLESVSHRDKNGAIEYEGNDERRFKRPRLSNISSSSSSPAYSSPQKKDVSATRSSTANERKPAKYSKNLLPDMSSTPLSNSGKRRSSLQATASSTSQSMFSRDQQNRIEDLEKSNKEKTARIKLLEERVDGLERSNSDEIKVLYGKLNHEIQGRRGQYQAILAAHQDLELRAARQKLQMQVMARLIRRQCERNRT